uniref:protein-glutamine gamma-glutamyltransferase E-like n=1 Tax=Styela clava TaxID=7725 RepID=UPI001939696A|nr:protein-glutamine gamma-glutamyltransferase E-like [Styela clava]
MGSAESRPERPEVPTPAPIVETTPDRTVDPDELMRLMNNNPNVVIQYYNSNRDFIEKYIVDHFWEEDVERWLIGIRERSPAENLQVRRIDFLKEKNEVEHHTSLFENNSLILRRSATFDLEIIFGNRGFESERDDLTLNFGVGPKPSEASGTKFVCPVLNKPGDKNTWHCYMLGQNTKKLSVRINIPVNAIIAKYSVSLDVVSGTSGGRKKITHNDNSIIVLFNPFVPDDTVYMEDERQREEYVMNDTGNIARGSYWRISLKSWDYAQFDAGVLDNVLKMIVNDSRHLAQPVKTWKKYNDPVYVSRVLSSMVNCNDDKGVLWGKWNGKYEDGKSPGYWNDSGKILKKWADENMQPVKYGQCWVFAGVLTTALRAVGIPARTISNFASAHDTNANVTVDMYYDEDTGDKLEETSDSIWNFHVWNEGFFRRPDLPEGYDGWQVVDSTPQEVSDVIDPGRNTRRELFQCGPAPVKAIKEGNILIGYDSNFIFGEVNADKVNWIVSGGKVRPGPEILRRSVGKNISTKAIGTYTMEDITDQYKYPEGSQEERIAFNRAYGRGKGDHSLRFIENPETLVKPKFEIQILLKEKNIFVGSKVVAQIMVKNISDSNVNAASIKISGSTKRHVGSIHALLKKLSQNVEIETGKEIIVSFEIDQADYIYNIVDNKVINIRVIATDTNDGNTKVEELDVQVVIPKCITTTAPDVFPFGVETKFDIIFENKFPITLTNGVFEVTFGGNEQNDRKFIVEQPIQPGEKYIVKDVVIKPRGNRRSINTNIDFDCTQIKDIQHNFRTTIRVL